MSVDEEDKKKINVLIVDDSEFSLGLLTKIVETAGYNIVGQVTNSQAAIDIAGEKKIHIAIIDVVMPNMNGIELTELLTKNLMNLKVIAVSSMAQENIIVSTIASGAVDFIQKPVKENILLASIEKIAEEIVDDL